MVGNDGSAIAEVISAPAITLYGTDDPEVILEKATRRAKVLAKVVEDRKLYTVIGPKKHVHIEGWTFLGTMYSAFPAVVWSRPIPNGWEARVEVRTLNGALVGAAENQCTRGEDKWQTKPDYALRSMAQTRAASKALKLPLGHVMVLAGYDATPAEEMDGVHDAPAKAKDKARTEAQPQRISPRDLLDLAEKAGMTLEQVGDWIDGNATKAKVRLPEGCTLEAALALLPGGVLAAMKAKLESRLAALDAEKKANGTDPDAELDKAFGPPQSAPTPADVQAQVDRIIGTPTVRGLREDVGVNVDDFFHECKERYKTTELEHMTQDQRDEIERDLKSGDLGRRIAAKKK